MKKSTIASLIGLSFTSPIFAAENTDIELSNVIVTASRVPETIEKSLRDISVINSDQIERAGQSSLVEVLQTQPGIQISNTGGPGKQSSIFIRGTNPRHVIVLVDGVRFNSATDGATALENIPVALIDRIEILRGPSASLYGQDAIGGVIQIFTKKGSGKPNAHISLGYGSFNTKTAQAGAYGSLNDTSFNLGISSVDTDGFSALKTRNPNLNDDDGYRNLSVTGSLSHKISPDHELGLQLLHSKGRTRFDSPSNLLYAVEPGFSDYADLTQYTYSVYSKNNLSKNWLSTLRIGEGSDELVNFSAIDNFGTPPRNLYRTQQQQFSWQNDINLPLGKLTLAYDRLEERVKSTTNYNQTSRNNDGYYAGYLANIGNHALQLNYRSDHNTRFGNNDTEGIAYGYQLNQNWRTTASYGTSFRAPSFNDMFFPDFFGYALSNPDLKAEKSKNIEASIRYSQDKTNASITIYENKIKDLIVFTGIPENIKKAKIQGVTFAASHAWNNWEISGSADILSPRDEDSDNLLIRRAHRNASAIINYTIGNLRLGAETLAVSRRYEDVANTNPIAGYAIFNLIANYKIQPSWTLQARINNFLDKDYALAYSGNPRNDGFAYNTPGANLFVSVRWDSK
jgi:vitamin B12 transporter